MYTYERVIKFKKFIKFILFYVSDGNFVIMWNEIWFFSLVDLIKIF